MWGAALFVTVCCTVAAASHPAARDQQTPSPVPNARARAPHKAGQGTEDGGEAHHGHHDIYAKYLALRHSPHLLELGLGCSSTAAALRQRYPAVARISFVEANASCAKQHEANISAASLGKPYVGTVDNGTLLESVRADSEGFGGFDVVIVARGHSAEQMLASIKALWHALKPGGIYIVEDISENYAEKPFGDKGTFVAFVKNAIDIVHCRTKPARAGTGSAARREFKAFCAANPMDIVSVECQPEACVLAKGRASNASQAVGALAGAAPKTPLLAGLLASLPVPAKALAKNLGLPASSGAAGAGAAGVAARAAAPGAAAEPETLDKGLGAAAAAADDAERADSRAERMLESGSSAGGGGADSLASQLMARQEVAYRRLKMVAAHMPAFDLGWIVAVSALASVCASLGLYASAVWRQWRRNVYRAQFIRSRDTS